LACLEPLLAGSAGEAIGRMRQAIALYRGKPWQWAVQLEDWLAEAGDKEGALAAYRQALEWKPGDEGIAARWKGTGAADCSI